MDNTTTSPTQNLIPHDDYSNQIEAEYMKKPDTHKLDTPFLVSHSDYLHLTLRPDGSVWSKTLFQDQDILLEIRGATIKEDQLQQIMAQLGRPSYDNRFGILLWLDTKAKMLLRPRGLSHYLLSSSMASHGKKMQKLKGNCFIEQQHGSKLLVKASCMIYKDEKLTMEEESIKKFAFPSQISDTL